MFRKIWGGVTLLLFVVTACSSGNNLPLANRPAQAGARFQTSSLPPLPPNAMRPSATVAGQTRKIESGATQMPATTAVTMFPTSQQYIVWASNTIFFYNLRIDYADGTSVLGYIVDGNSLLIRHTDGSASWWDVEFTGNSADKNVYLTMTKTGFISAPAPLPAPSSPAGHGGCARVCNSASVRHINSVGCLAVGAAAGMLGQTAFAAASADAILTVGATVGSLVGPEGTAAGIIFGVYAIGNLGVGTAAQMIGANVFGTIAAALCETLENMNGSKTGHAALGGGGGDSIDLGNEGGFPGVWYQLPNGYTTSSWCCVKLPTPPPIPEKQ